MLSSFRRKVIATSAPLLLTLALSVFATAPAVACACCESWQVTGVEEDDVLNMRAKPKASSNKVGEIEPGAACVSKVNPDCKKRWCKVEYNGQTGYVNTKYLKWKP